VRDWLGPHIDSEYKPVQSQRRRSSAGGANYAPPPPPGLPPPIPPSPSTTVIPNQTQPQFLSLFNQTASQRHMTITWAQEMSGQSHSPHWKVTLLSALSSALLFRPL
jgi:hypothetical protein